MFCFSGDGSGLDLCRVDYEPAYSDAIVDAAEPRSAPFAWGDDVTLDLWGSHVG